MVFTKYSGNPVLGPQAFPGDIMYVFNPGAIRYNGEYLLIVDAATAATPNGAYPPNAVPCAPANPAAQAAACQRSLRTAVDAKNSQMDARRSSARPFPPAISSPLLLFFHPGRSGPLL